MSWKCFKLMLLLFGVLAIAIPVQAQNLLTNGDFNTGDLTGWTDNIWDPDNQSVTVLPGSDGKNYDATPFAEIWCNTAWAVELRQTVVLGPGATPRVTLMHKTTTPASGAAGVNIGYFDSGDGWLDYFWATMYDWSPDDANISPFLGPTEWTSFDTDDLTYSGGGDTGPGEYKGTNVAPANTAYVVLSLNVWDETNGTLYADDVVFTPEPATIAMLGLGGLALLRRKRA